MGIRGVHNMWPLFLTLAKTEGFPVANRKPPKKNLSAARKLFAQHPHPYKKICASIKS